MKVILIAANTITGIVREQAVYVWLLAMLTVPLAAQHALFPPNPTPAGIAFVRAEAIASVLQAWALVCIAAAAFLGGTSMARDFTSRAILAMLARPLYRSELLLGRWLGVLAFSALTLAIGYILTLSTAAYLDIPTDLSVLGIATARALAAIAFFGALGVALTAFGASLTLAIGLSAIVAMFPTLMDSLSVSGVDKTAGVHVLERLLAPEYENQYIGITWAPLPGVSSTVSAERPFADYSGQLVKAFVTLAYAAAYLLAGCVRFGRRDLVGERS